jgi:molybdopterin molybdotransferase
MQEDCAAHTQDGIDFVIIPPGLKQEPTAQSGEDFGRAPVVVSARAVAAAGNRAIARRAEFDRVFQRLRMRWFHTGTRSSARRTARSGQVYDSNTSCSAPCCRHGSDAMDAGVLPDREEAITSASQLATDHDAVLTTGGASRGEEDHLSLRWTGSASATSGSWREAGRPMGFGQIGDCPVVTLPGNPVAAFVCFLLCAARCSPSWAAGNGRSRSAFELAPRSRCSRESWAAASSFAAAIRGEGGAGGQQVSRATGRV